VANGSMLSDDMKALLASQPKTDVLREYRWSAPMFYRALDAGAFGLWPKVELVRGRLIEHPGQTPPHANTVGRVGRRFRNVLEPALQVFEHHPLAIAEDTHVDTDVLVIIGRRSEYEERHPGPADTSLLVEVSDLTASYDLGEKALLYAQAGIGDYWVVLVNEAIIVRHREPTAEGYKEVTRLAGTDALSPLAMPEVVWTIDALLGARSNP
jgi:Uma2 family endonuclease